MSDVAHALAQLFRAIAPLGDEPLRRLAAATTVRRFDTNAWLLRGGDRAELCFLLTKGLVRELYVAEDGGEHTRSFVAEHQLTGSLLDLLSGAPSITFIQALELTETLAFRYDTFNELCAQFVELLVIARITAERLYVKKARREHEMLALTADQRYGRWLETNPTLAARVSQRHLASYLGIRPEHLSRLRTARSSTRSAPATREKK